MLPVRGCSLFFPPSLASARTGYICTDARIFIYIYLFIFILFYFIWVVVARWKRERKNFGFRFSISKIPEIPALRRQSHEKKKVFSA
jgi:hypothetical protein